MIRRNATTRSGFTLAELMIAILFLGVGLAAAAALIPAGVLETQRSLNDVNGRIVAQDALDLACERVTATQVANAASAQGVPLAVLADADHTGILAANDHYIPAGQDVSSFVLLGRTVTEGQQLVAVACAKRRGANDVIADTIEVGINQGARSTAQMSNPAEADRRYLNSPLILPGGEFARVIGVDEDNDTLSLDRRLPVPDGWSGDVYVILERDGAGTFVTRGSPATVTISRTTKLQP